MKYIVYAGHNTDERHAGIRVLEADAETGRFREVRVIAVQNAIFMALNAARTRLYTALSDPAFGPAGHDGGLAAYEIRGDELIRINAVATGHTAPCHLALAPDERALAYAEYSNGTAGAVELTADGALAETHPAVAFSDEPGPNKPRQDRPHAHCTAISPDGRFLHVVDLGTDRIKTFDWAGRAGGLREIPERTFHTSPAGAGPRHVIFHPNGRLAFVVFELGNLVMSCRYADGVFTPVQTLPLLPEDFDGFSKAAAIHLSEDGRQLFCSNRGHDSLTVFSVDPESGALARLGILPLGGAFPRDFAFFPGGRFLMAGLKMSGVVRTYAYDASACTLEPVMEKTGWYRPLFFAFGAGC